MEKVGPYEVLQEDEMNPTCHYPKWRTSLGESKEEGC